MSTEVCFIVFFVSYLMMLSKVRLHAANDRMINECGTSGGMNIGRRNKYKVYTKEGCSFKS
jgi:hypothetical protein